MSKQIKQEKDIKVDNKEFLPIKVFEQNSLSLLKQWLKKHLYFYQLEWGNDPIYRFPFILVIVSPIMRYSDICFGDMINLDLTCNLLRDIINNNCRIRLGVFSG
jgi:hypothetical protein